MCPAAPGPRCGKLRPVRPLVALNPEKLILQQIKRSPLQQAGRQAGCEPPDGRPATISPSTPRSSRFPPPDFLNSPCKHQSTQKNVPSLSQEVRHPAARLQTPLLPGVTPWIEPQPKQTYPLSRINFSLTTTRTARSTIRNSKSENPRISPSISSRSGPSALNRILPPRKSDTRGIS